MSEPWPTCAEDHAIDGEPIAQEAAIEDLRRILHGDPLESEAELRRLDPGVAAALTRMLYGHDASAAAPRQLSPVRAAPNQSVAMASVLQLYRRDVPKGIAPLPKWMFPGGTDMLQVLWCPNPHADDYVPRVCLYWRTESELGTVVDANPTLSLFTRDEDVDFTPRACVLHPELVQEYPPITLTDPDEDDLTDTLVGILPAGLEQDCARWTATGEPRDDFDQHDYADHAGAPGWKMGGWLPNVGFWPPPAERCSCGAPTVLLLGATSEALNGPWLPHGDPGFRWGDPEDWDDNRPTGVWGGRGGQLWLLVCADDPTHPILAYTE